jgi:hypothetical protein
MKKKALIILLFAITCSALTTCKKYDIENDGIPKFIKTDFTDLSKITRISKFRSGSGHDYSDDFEDCRSMKHYYSTDTTIEPMENILANVYAPVSGRIVKLRKEKSDDGDQIWIKSDEYPAFVIAIFHVHTLESIKYMHKVSEGEMLGDSYGSDIAVRVRTKDGIRLISYFEVMTDELFYQYQLRGITNRDTMIFSKEYRDANPIECSGDEVFPNQWLTFYDDWVILQ